MPGETFKLVQNPNIHYIQILKILFCLFSKKVETSEKKCNERLVVQGNKDRQKLLLTQN